MIFNDLYIKNINDLKTAVTELGFVPFFENSIPSFSIEEHVDPRIWFSNEDGLVYIGDKRLYDLLDDNAPILSKHLKQIGNYRKGGNKGFEACNRDTVLLLTSGAPTEQNPIPIQWYSVFGRLGWKNLGMVLGTGKIDEARTLGASIQ